MKIQFSDMLERLPEQFFASLVQKVGVLEREGYDIIKLGQGNPDGQTPEHIVRKLQEATMNPNFHGYSPFSGYSFLKEAVSTFYKREYQVDLDPEKEVAILFGGKTGLVEISQCLLNAGDTVLVPDPGYPDYMSGIAMAKAEMYKMPLVQENSFLPDYDAIPDTVLKNAKLMFLNYPNNPTGAIATEDFFKDTINLAYKHEIPIVHDFAYGAIGFDGNKPKSFLELPGAKEVGIEIYTLSKTYNMAGWRVAFAVGNQQIIKALELMHNHYYVSLFGGIQAAAQEALLGPQDAVSAIVKRYEQRRDFFYNAITNIGWEATPPAGTFFGWLPVPNGYNSVSFTDLLLNKAHVAVAPGAGFGENGDSYVRIGLLAEESRLLEAVDRIRQLKIF